MRIIKIVFILLLILFLSIGMARAKTVKNPDQPEKGEWSFSPQKEWETDHAGEDILVEIRDIRIDDRGRVFVLDGRLNKVHVFKPQGQHLFSFAKRGEGPGEIKDTYQLFLVDDTIIIPDMNKIHYFSRDGTFIKSIPAPAMFIPYLFLAEHRVLAVPFSSLNKEKREVRLYNLETKEQKEIFQIPKVKALRYSDERVRLMLRMPFEAAEELVTVKGQRDIWYGYSDTYRIKRLDLAGGEPTDFAVEGRERERISQKDKTGIFGKVMEAQRELPNNVLKAMADQIPDKMPYFHHLFADQSGLIHVLTATSRLPHRRKVDIFTPQGRYLYRGLIDLEPGDSIIRMTMNDQNLAAFVEDSDGERKLVKYTLRLPKQE